MFVSFKKNDFFQPIAIEIALIETAVKGPVFIRSWYKYILIFLQYQSLIGSKSSGKFDSESVFVIWSLSCQVLQSIRTKK